MIHVCFLGAGSAFVEPLSKDLCQIEGIEGGTLWLVDIDEKRLDLSAKLAQLIVERLGANWTVKATTDRKEALAGADYVINCIEVSGLDTVRFDNDIPLKYGISQCIGDTIGPGGIFKLLRTAPVWVEVLQDCEQLCPDALVLNYTNPMNMMCLVAARTSNMRVVGLCHSVQGTSKQLSEYADVPYDELEWECAGINHLAWFTKLEHRGSDIYPRLRERAEARGEVWEKDPIRFDMMLHFGAFVTESSGHFSEYLPYYRKRSALMDEYCRKGYLGEEGFYARDWPTWRAEADERRQRLLDGAEELKLERSHEYASYIIQACETDQPYVIHGNVPNDGLIDNLLADGCVEVACLIDGNGVHPTHYGSLPPQLAALCRSNMSVFELGVQAVLQQSKEAATHALLLDPLTAAVCSPAEIRQLAEEMFAAEADYLPAMC
jgi:alpha-galactosidase